MKESAPLRKSYHNVYTYMFETALASTYCRPVFCQLLRGHFNQLDAK